MPFGYHMGESAPKGNTGKPYQRKHIDVSLVARLLEYDPVHGVLLWKRRPIWMFESPRVGKSWNTKHAGTVAARPGPGGYLHVCIFNERFLAHRVAWAIHYGEQPPEILDHINRDRADIRISNLRSVSAAENARNQSIRSDNRSGIGGIWRLSPKKWGKPWAVALGGKTKMIYKRHRNFCSAIRHRNEVMAAKGFTKTHGGFVSIGDLAAALAAKAGGK